MPTLTLSRPCLRRHAGTLLLLCSALLLPAAALADAKPFTLPDLPYPADHLAPVIAAETMQLHHGRHHASYVAQLNAAVSRFPDLAGQSLEAVQRQISRYDQDVRNQAGGHYNHSLFWTLMTAPGQGGEPEGSLRSALERDFGDVASFQREFDSAARRVFGSGWAWLIVRDDGRLAVTSTANQDNPLMDVLPASEQGAPILALDVWEHAYYLDYRNRRGDYIEGWWSLVDWSQVQRLYEQATGK